MNKEGISFQDLLGRTLKGITAYQTQLFFEDWEAGNFDDWSNFQWTIGTDRDHDPGLNSAKCNGNADGLECNMSTTVSLDTSGAESVNVSFWYNDDDNEPADAIWYWYDNGGNWDSMGNIDAGSLGKSDDTWNYHSVASSESQYLHSNFAIRFWTGLEKAENYWLDDINVSYEPIPPDVSPPTWSSNSTNGTTAGTWINHSVKWTNEDLSNFTFSFDNGTGTFVNDSNAPMTGTSNQSYAVKYVNQTAGSTIRWQVYAWDLVGNNNVTDIFTYTTIAPSDTTYPQFTDYDMTENNTEAGDKIFNVTVTFTNGTVWLDFDNYNWSASNIAGDTYEATVTGKDAGTYSYNWGAFGSGTENLINVSNTFDYTIKEAEAPPTGASKIVFQGTNSRLIFNEGKFVLAGT